jgi:hypothetical protein
MIKNNDDYIGVKFSGILRGREYSEDVDVDDRVIFK